jgi:hypothetical protein
MLLSMAKNVDERSFSMGGSRLRALVMQNHVKHLPEERTRKFREHK